MGVSPWCADSARSSAAVAPTPAAVCGTIAPGLPEGYCLSKPQSKVATPGDGQSQTTHAGACTPLATPGP